MTDDTRKADVKNWRRGYEAALSGEAYVGDEEPSAWRLGYRDGRPSWRRCRQDRAAGWRHDAPAWPAASSGHSEANGETERGSTIYVRVSDESKRRID